MITHCQIKAHRILRQPRKEWAALIAALPQCQHTDCTAPGDCQSVVRNYMLSLIDRQKNQGARR